MNSFKALIAASTVLGTLGMAQATDLEVTHWWTSGGEAAAVAEFAKAFDATGNKWVDGAIAGGGGTARPIMISRITGGDPMAATQFNHGRQAEELVQAGLMRDSHRTRQEGRLEGLRQAGEPARLAARVDGKIYCVPINIHSLAMAVAVAQGVREAGVPVPKTGTSSSPPRRRSRRPARCRSPSAARAWQTTWPSRC
jgi:glucose/mannose transport system substrate-binding protein